MTVGGGVNRGLVAGVDGGGSHVRAVVVDEWLRVLGEGEGPGANPGTVGREEAAERVAQAVSAALGQAGVEAVQVQAIALGIAGAAAAHSRPWVLELGRSLAPRAVVVPSADYEIALAGANGRLEGVVIAAGTGSVAYGVSSGGLAHLAGGWGRLLGDEGSGYWLGLQGLRAVAQALDGQGPPTSLSVELPATLGLELDRAAVIGWLYWADPRQAEVSKLAPEVLQAAEAGDPVAGAIVTRGAEHLAHLGRTVVERLGLTEPEYAFAGGLLRAPNPLSLALCRELGLAELPQPLYPPVLGAALMALQAIGLGGDLAHRE